MRIMITGGGTGGHAFPAVAVLEELQRRDPRLTAQWIGRKGAIEERISRQRSIAFRPLPVEGWPRKLGPRKIWVAAKMAWSLARAFGYLRSFRPDVVLGVGGYVSLPVVYAAQRMGIPTVLHEQNQRLGVANRLLAPRATRVFLSFQNTLGAVPAGRSTVVGNPVRMDFLNPPPRTEARSRLGLRDDQPVVLVYGGSQGAGSINTALAEALHLFEKDELQIIWGTGPSGVAAAREAAEKAAIPVQVHGFIDDMVAACAAADLVVCRSGASGTAELACLGKPAILIPYPHATDNHQEHNARAFEEVGAAVVMLDNACTPAALCDAIRSTLADPQQLMAMSDAAKKLARPQAADTIVDAILAEVFGPVAIDA